MQEDNSNWRTLTTSLPSLIKIFLAKKRDKPLIVNASKIALVHLVARLVKGGFCLLDTQFVTNHLSQFGAVEIHRSGYRLLLSSALNKNGNFHQDLDEAELSFFIQSTTQTS